MCPLPVSLPRFTWNSLKPSVDAPPRSPTDDTEFSAQHARRVIGSGVVLERKASISAGPVPELKNKVYSSYSIEILLTNSGDGSMNPPIWRFWLWLYRSNGAVSGHGGVRF